jgi:predicted GNAT family N-acyltransferase
MPAVLIGRLAVDVEFQGQGLGSYLLISALERVIQAESDVASFAIVVDAKDGAIPFYEQYGFIRVPSRSNRLFLPVETAKQSFGK